MNTLLVTGPFGHIGSRLIRTLPEEFPEMKIILVDNLSTQRYCSLFNLPKSASFEFHEMDVTDAEVEKLIEKSSAVVHLAAMTDATSSLKQPELIAKNLEGTRNVAMHCARHGVPMLFSSTTSVYGSQKEEVDESCSNQDLKPQSPYADYKIQEERCLSEIAAEHKLEYVICRFGTICGVSPGMRFHTAVNKFCFQAVMKQPITVWRTAFDQRRPYLELGDACDAVAHILKNKLFNNEIYNVVSENLTVRNIIDGIKPHVAGLEIKFVDSQIMNQLSYTVLSGKFQGSGFKSRGKVYQAIADTVALLKNANS